MGEIKPGGSRQSGGMEGYGPGLVAPGGAGRRIGRRGGECGRERRIGEGEGRLPELVFIACK